jgi:dTMP kinase
MFITFEGPDGSGKSTQWQRCVEALTQTLGAAKVLPTRNPGGTLWGQEVRRLLLTPPAPLEAEPLAPMAELLLYMADRAQHVAHVVAPALAAGQVVVCDRFVDSTVAYQGAARGLSAEVITPLNRMACTTPEGQLIWPQLTFLLDAPVAVLAQRVAQRGELDRLEREGLVFKEKVRQGFLAQAQAEPQRFVVLDATLPIATLAAEVARALQQRFGLGTSFLLQ